MKLIFIFNYATPPPVCTAELNASSLSQTWFTAWSSSMQRLIVVFCSWPLQSHTMATTATAPVRRSAARRVVKIVSILFTLLLAAMIIFGLWFRHAAQSSLAQLDGTLALSGLHEPVHVVRDVHGVPHLTAANLHDLFFAQGYITAQDRMWQMDLTRRAVAGEMAEVFPGGPPQSPAARANGTP